MKYALIVSYDKHKPKDGEIIEIFDEHKQASDAILESNINRTMLSIRRISDNRRIGDSIRL